RAPIAVLGLVARAAGELAAVAVVGEALVLAGGKLDAAQLVGVIAELAPEGECRHRRDGKTREQQAGDDDRLHGLPRWFCAIWPALRPPRSPRVAPLSPTRPRVSRPFRTDVMQWREDARASARLLELHCVARHDLAAMFTRGRTSPE